MYEASVSKPAVNKNGPLRVRTSCKDPVLISRAAANALITAKLNIVFQSYYVWPDHFKLCEDDENILDASKR